MPPYYSLLHGLSTQKGCLPKKEDQVDDDVKEWLTEDHEHDEGSAEEATEQSRAYLGSTECTSHHERVTTYICIHDIT